MITVGQTVIHEDDCVDIRWAVKTALKEQKKVVKKMEDLELDPREATARDANLRRFLRLIDPTGQVDGIDEAERQRKSREKQEEMPFTADPDAVDTTVGTWAARRLDEPKLLETKDAEDHVTGQTLCHYVVENELGKALGYYVTEEEATAAADRVNKLNAEGAQPDPEAPADEGQVKILLEGAATGDAFKEIVAIANLATCRTALETADGQLRRTAIEKRIALLEGRPEGQYDLTQARKRALDVLVNAVGRTATISSKTTLNPNGSTIAKPAATWLIDEGLAVGDYDGKTIALKESGFDLCVRLGYAVAPAATSEPSEGGIGPENESSTPGGVSEETPDAVVPNDDDFGGPIGDEEEDGERELTGVGSFDGLSDDQQLL